MLEVDIDIGRLVAFLADKALEQHVATRRIDLRHPKAIADSAVRGGAAALAEDVLATCESHDVVDRQEVRLILQFGDQLQLVFDLRLHVERYPVGEAPVRADISLLTQIRRWRVAGRHELVGILVAQLVERERAAPRDADRLLQRAGRVEVGQAQPGSQVPLGVRRELVATLAHRPAEPDPRQHVLQGLPRAHVHQGPAGGHHWHVVARGGPLDGASVDVVHRPGMQRQRDPRAIAEHARDPFELRIEALFGRGKIGREDDHAVRQASQMLERCLGMLEVHRRQAIRALRRARAAERDEFAEIAIALAVHREGREGEGGRPVAGGQAKVGADDQRQACGLRFHVCAHDAGQRALVRDRDRTVPKARRARSTSSSAREAPCRNEKLLAHCSSA